MSKLCTSIEQSQKLIDLGIDINTADMLWTYDFVVDDINGLNVISEHFKPEENDVPAWSLDALLNIIERTALFKTPQGWMCQTYVKEKVINLDNYCDNSIDAAFEMVCWLKENGIL